MPRKNIKLFFGKPIIAYSIEAALKSGLFDEVMVSTDDKEIADIAQQFGAKIPFFRSTKNSDDQATTIDVLLEVLKEYSKEKIEFDYGCCIYPAAPFVTPELIEKFFQKLKEGKWDSIIPVVEYGHPIFRALTLKDDDKLEFINKKSIHSRTQDLKKSYHDSGQFYWFNINRLLKHKTLFMKNTTSIQVARDKVQDIDNEDDWGIAELKFKLNNKI